jgi:transcriptional accessory protein Tex/SPT6
MNKFRSFYSVTVAKNLKSHLQVAISTALLLVTVEARQTRPVDIFSTKLKDQLDQLEKDLV